MTSEETTKLVALIAQLWPAMKINEYTADAWHPALADLDIDDAVTAVYALIKSSPGFIGIADIRRRAAAMAGLLAPDEGDAFDMAAKVGLNSGVGARMLPGPVQDAYWQMGGAPAFEDPAGMVRSRWNKVYAGCVAKRETELLVGDLGAAIANTRASAAALPPADRRDAIDGG